MAQAFISIDKPFYFAGDTVQGQVFLNLATVMMANEVVVKFKGWESVRWFEERIVSEQERATIASTLIFNAMIRIRMDSSDSEDHPGEDESSKYRYVQDGYILKEIIKHSGERQIARFQNVIYNFEGSLIPAGQYAFPFSFKTGENYPASYMDKSIQNNRRGRIKYEMQAFVRGFNARLMLIRCKQEIIMRETVSIKNDHQIMEAHVTSCCCIDQGTTRIECYFEKNAYTPGEEAKIYCKCDNTEGKSAVVSVDVSLVNQITYTSSEAYKKVFREVLFKKSFQGLGIGEKGQRQQSVQILNSQIGTNAQDIKPTAQGSRLHSIYFLMVEANLAASCTCCSNLPIVKQPILIFPFIPVNYYFKAPPNWAPVIMPMKVFTVSLGGLGVSMNGMGMNMQMNVPSMQVNMNAPVVNVPPPTMNVSMNVNAPPPPNFNVQMGVPAMNVEVNNPGLYATHHSPHVHVQHNANMNMNMNMGMNMNMNMNTNMSPNKANISANGGGMHMNMSPTKSNVSINGGGMNVSVKGGMGPSFGMNAKMF